MMVQIYQNLKIDIIRVSITHLLFVSSQCSAECGSGYKSRNVICSTAGAAGAVSQDTCAGLTKPRVSKACNRPSCGAKWVMSEWSQVRCIICSTDGPFVLMVHVCCWPTEQSVILCRSVIFSLDKCRQCSQGTWKCVSFLIAGSQRLVKTCAEGIQAFI